MFLSPTQLPGNKNTEKNTEISENIVTESEILDASEDATN